MRSPMITGVIVGLLVGLLAGLHAGDAETLTLSLDPPGTPDKVIPPFQNNLGPIVRPFEDGKVELVLGETRLLLKQDGKDMKWAAGGRDEDLDAGLKVVKPGEPLSFPFSFAGKQGRYTILPLGARGIAAFFPATTISGILDGRKVAILDANCNGCFDDVGVDLICVGPGTLKPQTSQKLQDMLAVGDSLVELSAAGGKPGVYRVTPYTGETVLVTLDGPSHNGVTLEHSEGKLAMSLSGGGKATVIPGTYLLRDHRFLAQDPKDPSVSCQLRADRVPPVAVEIAGKTHELVLGGPPFTLDFGAQVEGDTITIASVSLIGAAGEAYMASLRCRDQRSSMSWSVRVGDQVLPGGKLDYG